MIAARNVALPLAAFLVLAATIGTWLTPLPSGDRPNVILITVDTLRPDRLSAYEQWSLSYQEAMRNELRRGIEVIESGETLTGATRFADGQGRHGIF